MAEGKRRVERERLIEEEAVKETSLFVRMSREYVFAQ